MLESQYGFLVGIDWATEEHQVCILNGERAVLEQRKYPHSGAGIAQLSDHLYELSGGDAACVAVGIETPRGAVVETLVERGFAVFSLNPKQMDRFRDRHTVSGAKDDVRDAYVIGEALGTDRHKFHRIRLDDPVILRLRELSRSEENCKHDLVRVGNQLRDLLIRYFPQWLTLDIGMDEPWLWEMLEKAPQPPQAAKQTAAQWQKILKAHRIRRLSGEQIHKALQAAALRLAPGAGEAASEHVLLLVPQLRLFHQQAKDLARRLERLLEEAGAEGQNGEHRDVNILLSSPGLGRCVAATMLAEASQALAERDYHALRSFGGIAPVTRRSGKKTLVVMRRSCNERLREAFYHWGRVSSQVDPHSKKHYAELRARGQTHGRAVRGVADRLLAVLVAMLQSGTLYDPAKRKPSASPA
jgi:transposase